MSIREFVGKKPPPEMSVMLKFKELNNRTPDSFKKTKKIKLNKI